MAGASRVQDRRRSPHLPPSRPRGWATATIDGDDGQSARRPWRASAATLAPFDHVPCVYRGRGRGQVGLLVREQRDVVRLAAIPIGRLQTLLERNRAQRAVLAPR